MGFLVWSGCLTLVLGFVCAVDASMVDVFKQGEKGYFCIKIPSLTRLSYNGSFLLATGEARLHSCSDYTETHLVYKTSRDGGRSWSVLAVLYAVAHSVVGNAAPVQLPNGTIVMPFCVNNSLFMVTTSANLGSSWTDPKDISTQVKQPHWNWVGAGPPASLVLRSGRIFVPAYHGPFHWDDGTYTHSVALFSDDGGSTWRSGESWSNLLDWSNECQAVELSNGTILMHARGALKRLIAASHDGGETWGKPRIISDLIQPFDGCEGSTFRDPVTNILYFSNPFNKSALRYNMSIHISKDSGASWSSYMQIDPLRSGYSAIQLIEDSKTGLLLYERAGNSSLKIFVPTAISLVRFTLM